MIYAILAAIITPLTSFLAGYRLRQQGEMLTAVAAVRRRRRQDVQHLRNLRVYLETATDGLTAEQALLLCDVCTCLELSDGEMQTVVGPAMLWVLDAPIGMGEEG